MFKTIRLQLLSIILVFALLTTVSTVVIFTYFMNSRDTVLGISQKTKTAYILLLEDVKVMHDFFENETINPQFFETGKSKLLSRHQRICRQIDQAISGLEAGAYENKDLLAQIRTFKDDFEIYKRNATSIISNILKRGFKDYGLEGDMRKFAHELEDFKNEIGLVNILQMRRHEKDFITRQEDEYIKKHEALVAKISKGLAERGNHNQRSEKALLSLQNYADRFKKLTSYEKKIGIKSGGGVKKTIDKVTDKMEDLFISMIANASKKAEDGLLHVRITFIIMWLISIGFGLLITLIIAKRLSRSVIDLKEKISEFVKSDFTKRTILPITDSTHEIDILASNFSIMEQHIVNQMTALRQSNKELEMLFYKASHDIKTPLCTVKGITNVAVAEVKDQKALEYLEMINKCWYNLNEIVEELGMVTDIKVEEFVSESINFDDLIHEVLQDLKSRPNFEEILFSVDISLKGRFYSSKSLVKTVFRHLLENGIKYSVKRDGFSFIKISIRWVKKDTVELVIADNGIGIPKEFQEKIFDMFFRGTTQASGTGLGLFIVQNSLQKLNGAIKVQSEENVGTTFTILLPDKIKVRNTIERIMQKKELDNHVTNLVLDYM